MTWLAYAYPAFRTDLERASDLFRSFREQSAHDPSGRTEHERMRPPLTCYCCASSSSAGELPHETSALPSLEPYAHLT
jgi:hypothetical protein